jgi:NAD(P)-dependent dehydrogenase (short-subunit alcohol dehydrogenase family)
MSEGAAILQGDVGDPDDARELVDGARELGPLSVLVNAAGVADPGPLESAPERIG